VPVSASDQVLKIGLIAINHYTNYLMKKNDLQCLDGSSTCIIKPTEYEKQKSH
jgi:hypothetical protein